MSDGGRLFTYGTLQRPAVQQALFGRLLNGTPATLSGFVSETIAMADSPATALGGEGVYPILRRTGRSADRIAGTAYALTAADLAAADAYETSAYARLSVTLDDGAAAFVYARAEEYLEDLASGQRHAFGRYEVTREEVLAFARSYDPQPFHLADEAAAQTHFGRLSASGWHTCAMTMAMLVAELARRGHQGLGGAGIDDLRWTKPVYPGDTLRCETEILDVTPSRSRPDMGSFRTRMAIFNQHDEAVLTYISRGLSKRRPA